MIEARGAKGACCVSVGVTSGLIGAIAVVAGVVEGAVVRGTVVVRGVVAGGVVAGTTGSSATTSGFAGELSRSAVITLGRQVSPAARNTAWW